MGVAVESDNELNRTMSSAAAAAGAGDLGFPVRCFFVKPAKRLATFGNRRPGLVGSRCVGDEAAGRDRNLAMLRGFSLRHAETAGLLRRGRKIRRGLGAGL